MDAIFLKIVNMSISACWIVLAIILLRVVLKKAPKWINCVLWGIAGLRLVMPFSFESIFSLVPSAETITKAPDSPRPQINSGVTVIDNQINGYLQGNYFEGVTRPAGNFTDINTILAVIWLIGIAALLIYTLISFLRLKRKIGTAILLRDNIYQSEAVVSPFVLGIIKPKIYLPFNMNTQDMEHVIAHEQAHIKRKDYLWKPLGFLILTLHWFNPMVWLGYILLCRDIELACDEKVVKELDNEQRADYSEALLTCSVNRRMIAACPLAFGEVGVKDRIKSVLNYKKPAFWIIIVAVVASITVAVCFLTNPVNSSIYNSSYETGKCLYSYVVTEDKETRMDDRVFDITSDGEVYKTFGVSTTESLGVLKESDYTAEDLESAMKNQDTKLSIGSIRNAYELSDCIFLQKSNGTIYLVEFFSDGRIMSVFKLNRIGKSDISNGSYKLSKELYFNGAYSYVPNFENDRIEIKTNGGMHIYHFTEEVLSTGGLYEEVALSEENFSNLFAYGDEWFNYNSLDNLLKNNKKAWCHNTPDNFGAYPYMLLLQKDGTLYMTFADFINGTPTRVRFIYELEYEGNIENSYNSTVGDADSMLDVAFESTLSYAGIPQKSNQIFYRSLNREKLSDSSVRHLPIHRLDTYEDLTNFKNTFSGDLTFDNGYDEIPSFNTATTKYDKEFFENNSLIVVFIDSTNSTHRYAMQSVEHNGIFCVQIEETTKAEAVDDALSGWFLTVTASDELLDRCTEFDAYINDKTDLYDGSKIPQLMVSCNGIWAEAVMGTTEWTFDNGDGTMQTINGDSAAHPTDRLDYLLPKALNVKRTDGELTAVTLNFDKKPDSIKVDSWFITENGDIKPFDTEKKGLDIFLNSSKETCIYEVVATWNSSDKYYGTVRYSFCVVKKAEENTPETTTAVIVDASGNLNPYFNAKVLEVKKNNILVEPLEGEAERNSASQIYVSTDVISTIPVPDLKKGDTVRIVYNGEIQETFPAQISKVFAIYEQ